MWAFLLFCAAMLLTAMGAMFASIMVRISWGDGGFLRAYGVASALILLMPAAPFWAIFVKMMSA